MRRASGSMSRGAAMSMRNRGRAWRPPWLARAARTSSARMTRPGAPVPLITMSAPASSARRASSGAALPPRAAASSAAFSNVRPPSTVARAPPFTRFLAAIALIFPAPTSITFLSRSSPKIFRPSSTATCDTDTALRPMAVSVRARLAAARERLRSALSAGPSVPASSATR
jgi:hypothetical protein